MAFSCAAPSGDCAPGDGAGVAKGSAALAGAMARGGAFAAAPAGPGARPAQAELASRATRASARTRRRGGLGFMTPSLGPRPRRDKPAPGPSHAARIEQVAQRVADEVEPENGQEHGHA